MTCRQLFYRLVSEKVIDKTENQYKGTVVRLLCVMRRDGDLPFHWIADNTRWVRCPDLHANLSDLLDDCVKTYRRDLWRSQDVSVEIWSEKDAIAGVLSDVTTKFGVSLMVTRGFPSLSFVYSAAEEIAEIGKPTYLYYFGDDGPFVFGECLDQPPH